MTKIFFEKKLAATTNFQKYAQSRRNFCRPPNLGGSDFWSYCGGQGSWTTLGPFFMKKIIEKKCHKKWPNSSVKKNTIFLFFFPPKKNYRKKNVVKKKCVFLFFFPKKNYRKKMSQKVTKLYTKKTHKPKILKSGNFLPKSKFWDNETFCGKIKTEEF